MSYLSNNSFLKNSYRSPALAALVVMLASPVALRSASKPPYQTAPVETVKEQIISPSQKLGEFDGDTYYFKSAGMGTGQIYRVSNSDHSKYAAVGLILSNKYQIQDAEKTGFYAVVTDKPASALTGSGGQSGPSPQTASQVQTETAQASVRQPQVRTISAAPQNYQTKGADPALRVLDQASLKYIIHDENDTGPIMDLNLIRELPSVLDDPAMMSYFALLNNCQAPAAAFRTLQVQRLTNELDFPEIAQFYKARAAEITKDVPRRLAFLFADFPSGRFNEPLTLGQYDMSTGSFPFINHLGTAVTVQYDNAVPARASVSCLGGTAQPAASRMARGQRIYPPAYTLSFPPLSFTRVQVDREAARTLLEKTSGRAPSVTVLVEAELLPGKPTEARAAGGTPIYTFRAEIKKATIILPAGRGDGIWKQSQPQMIIGTVYP